MQKKLLYIILIIVVAFPMNSAKALVSGHYETNGKGCYMVKSLMGGKAKICNCFDNETPLIVGGIITSIAICTPDSLSYEQIDFFPIPFVLDKIGISYLNSYKNFLESINTENTNKLAECIQDFFDSINSQVVKDYNQSEIDYMKIYDSLNSEVKNKIEKWIEFNHL
ncbi:MAG: hypothetical protein A2X64_08415 [Ignavibacteria bacterium GWF2_33_9]|nr:MAG: hypothetical protein A2X64_08415 [Ignavibacteria bacterium GWF2_33_9]